LLNDHEHDVISGLGGLLWTLIQWEAKDKGVTEVEYLHTLREHVWKEQEKAL
jgi:hypothetical protein